MSVDNSSGDTQSIPFFNYSVSKKNPLLAVGRGFSEESSLVPFDSLELYGYKQFI